MLEDLVDIGILCMTLCCIWMIVGTKDGDWQ